MSDELLRIENVTKKYGKTVANSDISFSVNAGETAVLLGPNGAGKSTIIKCIAGLLRFSGKILICGEPNKTLPAKRELGYIPELPAVYELLTVEEHLEFIRRAYRVEDDGYGNSLLERLELDDKRKKLGRELSKGMQQKLSICCALVHRPRVLIFDEPLVGLDPARHQGAQNSLPRAARRGPRRAHLHAHDRERRGLLGRGAHHDERPLRRHQAQHARGHRQSEPRGPVL